LASLISRVIDGDCSLQLKLSPDQNNYLALLTLLVPRWSNGSEKHNEGIKERPLTDKQRVHFCTNLKVPQFEREAFCLDQSHTHV
jgi:hypothetical protein